MNPLRTLANRTLIALTGSLLLAGGGWLAATARPVADRLPGGWPGPAPGTVPLDRSGLAELRDHNWWTPAVVVVGTCALLLFLAWFLTQARPGGRRRLPLAAPSVSLRSRALAEAVAGRAEATPGVARAHVRLSAGPKRSRARIRLLLEPGAEPGAILDRLTHGALDEARRSLAPHRLETHVRMEVRARRQRRTR